MEIGQIVLWVIVVAVLLIIAWKKLPKFRDKASKYVDKDGDGRPFQ